MGSDRELQAAAGKLGGSDRASVPGQPSEAGRSVGASRHADPEADAGRPADAYNGAAGADAGANDAVTPDSDDAANLTRRRSWLTETVVLLVLVLLLTIAVKAFLIQPFRIPSQSMENTLLVNDKVLVNKLVGHVSQIQRGDIIVFNGAGSWNPPSRSHGANVLTRVLHDVSGLFVSGAGETYYIKRVIGLPGDHVRCCNAQGLITVNGIPLHERAYLYPGSLPSTVRFSIVVPPGRLWVMGDNRDDSEDSRFFLCGVPGAQCNPWDRDGTIPENMVVGRAFMIVWPPSRVRLLSVPPTFNQPGLNSPRRRPAKGRLHAARTAGRTATRTGGRTRPAAGASTGARTTASADGLLGLAADEGMRVVPADPLPLWIAGIGVAVPLTLLERTVRLRRGHGRSRQAGRPT
jgi:signal peptidase I